MAAYELGSARSYYGMSESIPYEQPPQKPPSGCRTALVIAAIVFGVLISVAVVAAIVLVFMQEPLDVSKLRSVNVNGRKHSFRSASSFKEMSFTDLLTNSGAFKTDFYSLWLGDSLAIFDTAGSLKIVNDSQRMGYGLPLANIREFKPGQRAQDALFNSDQRLVALSSDVRHVFVYENNIYYQSDYMFGQPLPVTTTGNEHKYHGIADWLYEEEIFSDSTALWWSSSGDYLAYASFDDKNVTSVRVPYYESGVSYPRYNQISYPKAGVDRQPTVFLWIWDKANNATKLLLPPEELFGLDDAYYLFSASWLRYVREDGSQMEVLSAVWSNRLQNEVFISLCTYESSQCVLNHRQSFTVNNKSLWAEPTDFRIRFQSKTGYFVVLPHVQADRRIYNHVAHIRIDLDSIQKGTVTAFHGGSTDVSEVVGYDVERDELYYLAPGQKPEEHHLYRVVKATEQSGLEPYCVSCRVPECRTADAKFSPSGRRFVLICSAPYIATRVYLKETVNVNPDHVLAELNESVQFDLPSVKFMQITLDDRFESSVRLILPPELDPTLPIKYPLLVLVYAGPGSNAAKAQTPWSLLTYFASKRRYVIACIDGRGSGGRGWDVKGPIYRNLGGPEVDDQIATVTKLKQLLPYLDDKAVGVFGWSYGGFVSAHIAARDAGRTFPCVAAIAAVTDYRLYDTAYTERYMGLVGNNTSGYERSNVLKNITGFQHVDFLLAHGEADDNVHYQNSALLAYALQERGIHFRQLVYTNQDHSIATARPHLYRELDMFFDECFKTSSTANTEPSSSVAPFTT